ncbi:hypothetical protein N9W34_03100 [Rickettsiales bacterium]|nr:hypothetical protein [Rickettsiales bacterium]
MIICRTPYRMSFFGGGTDYHNWYQEHGGAVLATTINHHCYVMCRFLPPFFENKHRIVWSKIEHADSPAEIEMPPVRAILDDLNIQRGVEIQHMGDLPARSGLGSSSAFTVGLLNSIYALRGIMSTKKQLACEAVHIERDILKENVGVQDQISTAYGGLNKIEIMQNGEFVVQPVILPQERRQALQKHMLLFFTGVSRTASTIAADKIKSIPKKQSQLHEMHKMVDIGLNILTQGGDLEDFGRLLHESWMLKRSLSKNISPEFIDDIYAKAYNAGAIGGKLLGAGGGGFMMFFAKPEHHQAIMDALKELLIIPVEFENSGSQIVFNDPRQYSQTSLVRRDYIHLQDENIKDEESLKIINKKRKSKISIVG